MSEKQFVEVNWFSKWTETLPEKRLLLQAKRAYGEGNLKAYLQPIPSILSVFLNRVDGVEVAVEVKAILRAMEELGVEEDKVLVALGSFERQCRRRWNPFLLAIGAGGYGNQVLLHSADLGITKQSHVRYARHTSICRIS